MSNNISEQEKLRLRDLHDYAILDTPPEESFDRITRLAKMTLQTPMSVVSLVADDRQWFKSRKGVTGCETARDISFCTHTIQLNEPLIVRDSHLDPALCQQSAGSWRSLYPLLYRRAAEYAGRLQHRRALRHGHGPA